MLRRNRRKAARTAAGLLQCLQLSWRSCLGGQWLSQVFCSRDWRLHVNRTPHPTHLSRVRLYKSRHARERNHQGHGVAMCVLRRDLQSVEGWLAQRSIIVGFEDTGQYPAAEQRRCLRSCASVARRGRPVLRSSGPSACPWVHPYACLLALEEEVSDDAFLGHRLVPDWPAWWGLQSVSAPCCA